MPSIALDKPRAAVCAGGNANGCATQPTSSEQDTFVRLPGINGFEFQRELGKASILIHHLHRRPWRYSHDGKSHKIWRGGGLDEALPRPGVVGGDQPGFWIATGPCANTTVKSPSCEVMGLVVSGMLNK